MGFIDRYRLELRSVPAANIFFILKRSDGMDPIGLESRRSFLPLSWSRCYRNSQLNPEKWSILGRLSKYAILMGFGGRGLYLYSGGPPLGGRRPSMRSEAFV